MAVLLARSVRVISHPVYEVVHSEWFTDLPEQQPPPPWGGAQAPRCPRRLNTAQMMASNSSATAAHMLTRRRPVATPPVGPTLET